jgi:hypothetical protein
MGEAKRRRLGANPTVIYHHTSSLNMLSIIKSGVLKIESDGDRVIELPDGNLIRMRRQPGRPMRDFPGLVWFTSRRRPPRTTAVSPEATALYRARLVAMPFRIADIGAVPWSEHYGYATEEGKFLNAAAVSTCFTSIY